MADDKKSERYEQGWKKLSEIHSQAGKDVLENLAKTAPDLVDYIIEYPFGDIYSRKGLDLRARQIATISSLVTLGNAQAQLKVHIQAGLNVGLSRQEIIEIIIQMSIYAGFPAALNGIQAAKEAFEEADCEDVTKKQPVKDE